MKYPKGVNLWLPSYLRDRARSLLPHGPAKRLWLALTDHFEPFGNTNLQHAHERMAVWQDRWPQIADSAPKDAQGRPPTFTAFYPQEEYEKTLVNSLAELAQTRTLDVEVHLHHFDDTAAGFVQKLEKFKKQLHEEHGLLRKINGNIVFGFIHGNWALDNSHPAGLGCGVTGELQLLKQLGCYADFTMPSAPSLTQSRIVNQIYWTKGDASKPRGFDRGVQVAQGAGRQGDLLMITGPLGLRYRGRLKPRLETGELAVYDLPTPYRVRRWLDLAPRIGDDIFVKLYGHSARDDNAAALLGTRAQPGAFASMFQQIRDAAQEQHLELHWASAFQMYLRVHELISHSATLSTQLLEKNLP